jgi:hypothetical protein
MLNPEVLDDRNGVRFTWNLKDKPNLNNYILIGHGHIPNVCGNGIVESLDRIKMLPKNTRFKFLRELK